MSENATTYRANNRPIAPPRLAVPPLRAVVMLHNGAITFLQRAMDAQEARRSRRATAT